jgi:plastocyanin
VLAAVLAVAALLAGCGGPETVSRPSGVNGEPPFPGVYVDGAPKRLVRVEMSSLEYEPAQVKIQPGGTVVFDNEDPVQRTAVARAPDSAPPAFAVGPVWPGGEARLTLERPGVYRYYDRLRPGVDGVIVVAKE